MFSVEGGADNPGGFEGSEADLSADDYSYPKSADARNNAGRKRKKPPLSVQDAEDSADDFESPRTDRPGNDD